MKNFGAGCRDLLIVGDYPTPTPCRSGGSASGDPNHVFDLGARHGEVCSDAGDAVAGLEAIDEILDASAALNDERKSESHARIDNYVGCSIGR